MNINRLTSMVFVALAWMVIPALIFSYYFFVWLDNQKEQETSRKLRALDEMTREFIATRNAIPYVVRNEQRRLVVNKNDPVLKDALEKEKKRLRRLLSMHQQELEALEAKVEAFKRQGDAGHSKADEDDTFIDKLGKRYADSVERMEKLHQLITPPNAVEQKELVDRLYREGENLKQLLEAEAAWIETAGLTGEQNEQYHQAKTKMILAQKRVAYIRERLEQLSNCNDTYTGSVTISDVAKKGKTLTVETGMIKEEDVAGAICFKYQWQRKKEPNGAFETISNATESSYTLTQEDINHTIKGIVSWGDDHGTARKVRTLTVETGAIKEEDVTGAIRFTHQWQRNTGPNGAFEIISGATESSYTLTQEDVDHTIQAIVTLKDDHGAVEKSLISNITVQVSNGNEPLIESVIIPGSAKKGKMLTVETGAIKEEDVAGAIRFTHQWERNTGPNGAFEIISGATESSYILTQADANHTVRGIVSWADDQGTARKGGMLTVETGAIKEEDVAGAIRFTHQWQRNTGPNGAFKIISGATESSYILTQEDANHTVRGIVSWADDQGTVEKSLISNITVQVSNSDEPPIGSMTISGTAKKGGTLTVETGAIKEEDVAGAIRFTHQWQRKKAPNGAFKIISNATESSYILKQADVNHIIQGIVSWTDDHGTVEKSLISDIKVQVSNSDESPIENVIISSVTKKGETLTVETGTIKEENVTSAICFAYQWQRKKGSNGAFETISNATESSYTLTQADVTHTIRAIVSWPDKCEPPLAFVHDSNNAEYFKSLDINLFYQPAGENDGLNGLCRHDTTSAQYKLGASGDDMVVTVCLPMVADPKYAKLFGANCDDNTNDHLGKCAWFQLSRAFWSFEDIKHLFQTHLRTPGARDFGHSGEFEGVLILDKEAKLIRAFGDTTAAFADFDFLKKEKSPLLELAKSDTRLSEGAAKQEVARSQALSLTSVWSVKIDATDYRLYIRPVKETATRTREGNGLFGFIVGLEKKTSFSTSVKRIPAVVQAGLALLVVIGLLALPVIRLRFLKETDAISPVEALTVIITTLLLFSILTIAGLTLAYRMEFTERTDNMAQRIAKKIENEFREELVDAVEATSEFEDKIFEDLAEEDKWVKYRWSSKNYFNIFADQTGPTCKKENSCKDKKYYGWFENGHKQGEQPKDNTKLPEFREIFALNSNGEPTGNIITNIRTASGSVSLKDRPYFQEVKNGMLWTVTDPEEEKQLFAQRIISRTTGERVTIVSKLPNKCMSTSCKNTEKPAVIAQSRIMQSVWRPILPPGFEFAIFDVETGLTLYHIHDHRSRVENFYKEIADSESLKATVSTRIKDTLVLEYRGQPIRASVRPIQGTPWVVAVFYGTDMYDQILISNLSVTSIAMTLYIVLLAFILLLTFGFFHKKSDFDYRPAFQKIFWPNEKEMKTYREIFIGLSGFLNVLLFAQCLAPRDLMLFVIPAGSLLTLVWLCVVFKEFADSADTVRRGYTENRVDHANAVPIRPMGKYKIFGRPVNWVWWTLITTLFTFAILPSSMILREVTLTQLERLEKFSTVKMLRSRRDRDTAVVETARTLSPWKVHQDPATTPFEETDSFSSVNKGEYCFSAFQKAEESKAGESECKIMSSSKREENEGNKTQTFVDWLLTIFNFNNSLFLRPYAHDRAEDGSWKVTGESAQCTIETPCYSTKMGTIEIPNIRYIVGKHLLLAPLVILALLLFIWFVRLYVNRLFEHLFGYASSVPPITSGQKSIAEALKQRGKVIFISPRSLEPDPSIGKKVVKNHIDTVVGDGQMDAEIVIFCDIEGRVFNPAKRRDLLHRLELREKKSDLKSILDCRINLLEFFANPQNYRSLIQAAASEKAAKEKAAKKDNADDGSKTRDDTVHPDTGFPTRDKALEIIDLGASELARWNNLLTKYIVHWVSEDHSKTVDPESGNRDATEGDIMDAMNRHQAQFASIWTHCTLSQQLALYHMANDELPAWAARHAVRDLAQLGILESSPPYIIRSRTLAAYIRSKVGFKKTALKAAAENKSWRRFQIPVLVILLAVVILIVVAGGSNFTESVQAIIGLLSASVALLFRFLPLGKG